MGGPVKPGHDKFICSGDDEYGDDGACDT
jgi:hypothetical protein